MISRPSAESAARRLKEAVAMLLDITVFATCKTARYLNFSLSNQLKLSSCERNTGSGVKLRQPQMSNELSPAVTVTLLSSLMYFFSFFFFEVGRGC